MSALPFLKPKVLPKLRKMSGVSHYGFSEDDELIESSIDELIMALENKDHHKFTQSLMALINLIMNKEPEDAGA
jgi:hypothetical protein